MRQLALELSARPEPTFANFVPGRNAEVVASLMALGAGANERFVFLWGAPASGRSHLLRAAVARAQALGRGATLLVAPHQPAGLETVHADAVLAIDDVERLDDAGQIALFAAYNRIRDGNGALVGAGPTAPAAIGVRADLATRLAWGLVFEVHALSDAEKAAAMHAHALARGFELPSDVVDYLLRHAPRDLASLLALIDALDRHSLETQRPVTVPLTRELLKPAAARTERI